MRILLTGATGFIGRRLAERLVKERHELVVLTRDPSRARGVLPSPYEAYAWNPQAGLPPEKALEGIEAVIHLAGEPVGQHRWSSAVKREIFASRVLSTRHLMQGLAKLPEGKPLTVISASAVGFYGNRGEELLSEESGPGDDFLAQTCLAWEFEATSRSPRDARLLIPRFGMVLGPNGGALERLVPVFKSGAGGHVGSGRQWVSCIHREDVVSILVQALTDDRYRGILNAVAPTPVRNAEFSEELAHSLGKHAWLPVPSFALKMALGEMASIALDSQRVSAAKLESWGFRFDYPFIRGALIDSVRGS